MKSTLISAQQLRDLDPRDVLVVDCRFELTDVAGGARNYRDAHIPGAVYADLNRDLSDLSKQGVGRHPLPESENFSEILCRWGWTPQTFVVAYDDAGGALAAARLWWMLRLCGTSNVAVLDGGLKAWVTAGFALDASLTVSESTTVNVKYDASKIVMTDELQRLRRDPRVLLLDARAASRYRGDAEPIDRVAGHIPGARNRPFSDNLDSDGRFKTPSELRSEFAAILENHASDHVVHMCGSGVTACHNLLAMEHAGLNGSRIYAPSWSGWVADPTRDVSTGKN